MILIRSLWPRRLEKEQLKKGGGVCAAAARVALIGKRRVAPQSAVNFPAMADIEDQNS